VEELHDGEQEVSARGGQGGCTGQDERYARNELQTEQLPYKTAMSHNRGLDRDRDGIACEKL
jgi:hypothetical protein